MASFLEFTRGSSWDFDVYYFDEAGEAEDVSTDVFALVDADPEVLTGVSITKPDAGQGRVHVHLPAEEAATLRVGEVCTFRISRTIDADRVETTLPIQVRIR